MKTYIPLDRLKRSRDSGSALYNMHPTDVLGRAGGGLKQKHKKQPFGDATDLVRGRR